MGKVEIIDKTKSLNKTLFNEVIPSILEPDEKLVSIIDELANYLVIKKGPWLRRKIIVAFYRGFFEYPLEMNVYTERGLEIAKKIGEQDNRGAIISKYYSEFC